MVQPPPVQRLAMPDRGAAWFVWGIWILAFCGGLVFAWNGSRFPFADDWELAEVLTGQQPFTGSWLWAQHSEHRIPLQKLVLLTGLYLSGGDFRSGIVANVVALGGLAFLLIGAARQLRGWTGYADAFFPLMLLHWGHASLLWGSHFAHVSPAVLAGILLWIMVRTGTPVTWGAATLGGACLVGLPLCGASGLVLAPVAAVWLTWGGLRAWRCGTQPGRWKGLLMLAWVGAAILVIGLYFHGYRSWAGHLASPAPTATVRNASYFLSASLGTTIATFAWLSWLGAVLLAASVGALGMALLRGRTDPVRAVSLLLFAAAVGSLALAIGWGRGAGPWELARQRHYSILAVPAWCAIFFIWETVSLRTGNRLVPMALLVLAGAVFWHHSPLLENSRQNRQLVRACEWHIRAGIPARLLAEFYGPFFWLDDAAEKAGAHAEELRKLQQAGVGPFRFLRDDPAAQDIPLPVIPQEVRQMTWKDGVGHGTGPDPQLTFTLPEPRRVYAIRLTCCLNYGNTVPTPVAFRMSWRPSPSSGADSAERNAGLVLDTGAAEQKVTILVNETIDRFCIHPDTKPCVFRLSEVMVVTPGRGEQFAASPAPGYK